MPLLPKRCPRNWGRWGVAVLPVLCPRGGPCCRLPLLGQVMYHCLPCSARGDHGAVALASYTVHRPHPPLGESVGHGGQGLARPPLML